MKIEYKQYFPIGIDYKYLCGHRGRITVEDAYELLDRIGHPGFKKENFRSMQISVAEFKGSNLGDYVPLDIFGDEDSHDTISLERANYMRILMARIPSWHLISMGVSSKGILLQFCQFGKDDWLDTFVPYSDFLDFEFEHPPYLKLRVDIESDEDHPAETYFVTDQFDERQNESIVSLEYYVEDKMQYHSIFGKDEKGYYELITDVD